MRSRSTRFSTGLIALSALLLMPALPLPAETGAFCLPSVMQNAMGGSHAALADDFDLLLSNPAALANADSHIFASQLGFMGDSQFFALASAYFSGAGESVMSSLLSGSGYKLQSRADLVGPLSFGMVGKGLGFGIFNRTEYFLNATSENSIQAGLNEDILVVGGYSYRMELGGGHNLDLGFLAKGFVRGTPSMTGTSADVAYLAEPMLLLAAPFSFTAGIGMDVGLRWNWEEKVAAGLVCRDAYSPAIVSTYTSLMDFFANPSTAVTGTGYDAVDPDLDFGLLWKPDWGGYDSYINGVTFVLDYDDILDLFSDAPRSPLLNIAAGAELKVLDILRVRAGLKDMLPAAGMGFDLTMVKVNAGLYGREYGSEPGEDPVYRLQVSLEFLY